MTLRIHAKINRLRLKSTQDETSVHFLPASKMYEHPPTPSIHATVTEIFTI